MDWIQLEVEYRESRRKVQKCIERIKNKESMSTIEIVDIEMLRGMRSNLSEVVAEMGRRAKFEFYIDEHYIPLLTPRQREIANAVIRHRSCTVAAKAIGSNPKTVFATWQTVVKKVANWKRQEMLGVPIGASRQQEKIYILHHAGKSKAEIAKELKISVENVREQLRRIRERINENVK